MHWQGIWKALFAIRQSHHSTSTARALPSQRTSAENREKQSCTRTLSWRRPPEPENPIHDANLLGR
eukprot:3939885-Rhodomonas_salina.2